MDCAVQHTSAVAAVLHCSINKRKKPNIKAIYGTCLQQERQFQVFGTKNTVYFTHFHLSASRLGKLTLFSYHKPLETPRFKNVFLNTRAKKNQSASY